MRRILTLVLIPFALSLIAVPVLAGNWATVTPDAEQPSPVAGQPSVVVLRVLQHGVTPVAWVTGTFDAVQDATGSRVSAEIHSRGELGRYVAELTFPEAGAWSWTVTLRELGTDAAGTLDVADGTIAGVLLGCATGSVTGSMVSAASVARQP